MSSTNGGPSVTTTPNIVVQAVPAGSSTSGYDPSSVAITGGTIGGTPIRNYLGVVASRGCVPTGFNASPKQAVGRSKHAAMENISALQLVFANWYLSGGEQSPGAAAQYTASIEYPIGTLAAIVKFGGATIGSVADGGTLVSDMTPVNIPRGAAIYVRMWQSCAAGIVHCANYGLNNVTGAVPNSGEWWAFGATVTDFTQTTTNVNNQQSGTHIKPAAIIGYTSNATFFIAGDSRLGNGTTNDNAPNSYGGLGEVERSLVKSFGTLNAGMSGEKLADAAGAGYARRIQLAQYCSHVICEYGINDFVTAAPVATMLANLATFAAKFGGKPFYQTTISPYTTSTDSWKATTDQTVSNPTTNTNRIAFNNAIRAGLSAPVTGHIEVADQTESSRDSGFWKVNGSAFAYTNDGLHANAAGAALVETSTAFQNIVF
jgi:lysophospholipase L1-like esterase